MLLTSLQTLKDFASKEAMNEGERPPLGQLVPGTPTSRLGQSGRAEPHSSEGKELQRKTGARRLRGTSLFFETGGG